MIKTLITLSQISREFTPKYSTLLHSLWEETGMLRENPRRSVQRWLALFTSTFSLRNVNETRDLRCEKWFKDYATKVLIPEAYNFRITMLLASVFITPNHVLYREQHVFYRRVQDTSFDVKCVSYDFCVFHEDYRLKRIK